MNKLQVIQQELNAPKDRFNSFGKYKYRSCEGILEALKPLLQKTETTMTITDEVVEIGGRVYVKATCVLRDADGNSLGKGEAYAREAASKSGMDEAQITGAASSYARKYALNGLFLIDDTKDPDTDEYQKQLKSAKSSVDEEKVLELCQQIICCGTIADVKAIFNRYAGTEYEQYIRSTCTKRRLELQKQGVTE